jgi:uncharacterized oxidoreductase
MTSLKGAIVLITGGTSGIGLALAAHLLRDGCVVIVCGRDAGRLADARQSLPGVEAQTCDVTDVAQVSALLQLIEKRWGRLDILVNNAGRMLEADFLQAPLPPGPMVEEIAVNLTAPILVTNLALPLIRRSDRGVINMVGSGNGWTPSARSPLYSAAKAGLRAFAKALRMQLAGVGVRVMEVVPPAVDTPSTVHRNVPKVSAARVAAEIVRGLGRGAREVFIGEARMIPIALRLAPRYLEARVGRS